QAPSPTSAYRRYSATPTHLRSCNTSATNRSGGSDASHIPCHRERRRIDPPGSCGPLPHAPPAGRRLHETEYRHEIGSQANGPETLSPPRGSPKKVVSNPSTALRSGCGGDCLFLKVSRFSRNGADVNINQSAAVRTPRSD